MGRKALHDKPLTPRQRDERRRQRERLERLTGAKLDGSPLPEKEHVFIGLDGESVEVPGGPDKYVLLAASDGSKVENWVDGLSTEDCLDYLLSLAKEHKRGRKRPWFLWFGMNYDVNCILKDLPLENLIELHEDGTTRIPRGRWGYLQITFHPGKRFVVSRKVQRAGGKVKTLTVFNSQDVFGFSQRSYAKTLLGWKIVNKDDDQFQAMESMKALRGSFSSLDPTQVTAYNEYEIQTLAELGARIYQTHLDVGLELRSMHGAGATAGTLLKVKGLKAHVMQDYPTPEIRDAVLGAYFGGRIQLHRQGWAEQVYAYDLRSAYPAAAVDLPSLQGASWRAVRRFDPKSWAVWHVKWSCEDNPDKAGHALYPLPVRWKGSILWPARGEGWYWTAEVDAARRAYPGSVQILGGYALDIQNPTRPFAFIPDLFRQRMEYKRAGSLAQQVLKLGLNAMYGKLAQKPLKRHDGRPQISPYQSFVYAGLITSLTRARLFEAAMTNPGAVLMFATDGIFTDAPLKVTPGDWLGDWEAETYGRGLFIQPGLYCTEQKDGSWYTKERGFRPSEIDWPAVRANYPEPVYTFQTRRFVALGAALARWGKPEKWPGQWREWPTSTRRVNTITNRWGPVGQAGDSWLMGYVEAPGPSEPYQVSDLFTGSALLKEEYEELTSQPEYYD